MSGFLLRLCYSGKNSHTLKLHTMYNKLFEKTYRKLRRTFWLLFFSISSFVLILLLSFFSYLIQKENQLSFIAISFLIASAAIYVLHFEHFFKKFLEGIIGNKIHFYETRTSEVSEKLHNKLMENMGEVMTNFSIVLGGGTIDKNAYTEREKVMLKLWRQIARYERKALFFKRLRRVYCTNIVVAM